MSQATPTIDEPPLDPAAMVAMVNAFTRVVDNFPSADVDEDLTESILVLVGVLRVKLMAFAATVAAERTDGR